MEFNATFLVTIINFILFTIIMNAIFYKPLQNIVLERQRFIDETTEEAKLHAKNAEAILTDKDKKIEKTKQNAKKLIVDKTDEVKTKKTALTSDAQKKAIQKITYAKDDLQKSKDEAQGVLSEEVTKLAEQISSKLLRN